MATGCAASSDRASKAGEETRACNASEETGACSTVGEPAVDRRGTHQEDIEPVRQPHQLNPRNETGKLVY